MYKELNCLSEQKRRTILYKSFMGRDAFGPNISGVVPKLMDPLYCLEFVGIYKDNFLLRYLLKSSRIHLISTNFALNT